MTSLHTLSSSLPPLAWRGVNPERAMLLRPWLTPHRPAQENPGSFLSPLPSLPDRRSESGHGGRASTTLPTTRSCTEDGDVNLGKASWRRSPSSWACKGEQHLTDRKDILAKKWQSQALAGVAQGAESGLQTVRAHARVAGQVPGWGRVRSKHFPPSLSPSLPRSLKVNK